MEKIAAHLNVWFCCAHTMEYEEDKKQNGARHVSIWYFDMCNKICAAVMSHISKRCLRTHTFYINAMYYI